ncbi:MAG: trehalose-6-phosphate synthase [Bryobacteraceae bacterium]
MASQSPYLPEQVSANGHGPPGPWNGGDVRTLGLENLQGCRLLVVSNREPYVHRYSGSLIECVQPTSGMAKALDPIMRAAGGTWIAHGSGSADRATVDRFDSVAVPPENPAYRLRRIWLTKQQEDAYYHGLANEGLWPLCHVAFARPQFRPADWHCYREVNEMFAQAVLEEAGPERTLVFIQDYHFALLPRLLKNRSPNLTVAYFWHIPWPNREVFRVFPWGDELLDGMLGSDLLGFHLRQHCQNFLDTVDRSIESKVDQERSEVTRGGKVTAVRDFPISIDFQQQASLAAGRTVAAEMDRWRLQLGLGEDFIGLGLDRLDYTKGIPEKLRAVDCFLEQHPAYRGRFVFVQVGVPSRSAIPRYQALAEEVDALVEQINRRWATRSWRPVVLIREHLGPVRMAALHRLAHFCFVGSLHDGMNLVAKEYVASRSDEDGVLVLSRFAGSALELGDAVLMNPYSLEEAAAAIHRAVEMPREERRRRMQRMRETVARRNIYWWAGKVMRALTRIDAASQMEQWEEAIA